MTRKALQIVFAGIGVGWLAIATHSFFPEVTSLLTLGNMRFLVVFVLPYALLIAFVVFMLRKISSQE